MPMFNRSRPKGHPFILLNTLRGLTLVSLVLTMVASWAMIVLSGLTGQFSFFDMLSHFWVFLLSVLLGVSECGLLTNWYQDNLPVLGPGHSLIWLGLALIAIGTEILDSLGKPVYGSANIGMPAWRVILAAGVLCLVSGVCNILASIVYRDSRNGITARDIRTAGALAMEQKENDVAAYDAFSQRSASVRGGGMEQEKAAGFVGTAPGKRFSGMFKNIRKSKISGPSPFSPNRQMAPADPEQGFGDENDDCPRDRFGNVMPIIPRPPSLQHPIHSTVTGDGSHYSEAHMDRF